MNWVKAADAQGIRFMTEADVEIYAEFDDIPRKMIEKIMTDGMSEDIKKENFISALEHLVDDRIFEVETHSAMGMSISIKTPSLENMVDKINWYDTFVEWANDWVLLNDKLTKEEQLAKLTSFGFSQNTIDRVDFGD